MRPRGRKSVKFLPDREHLLEERISLSGVGGAAAAQVKVWPDLPENPFAPAVPLPKPIILPGGWYKWPGERFPHLLGPDGRIPEPPNPYPEPIRPPSSPPRSPFIQGPGLRTAL